MCKIKKKYNFNLTMGQELDCMVNKVSIFFKRTVTFLPTFQNRFHEFD